MGESAPLPPHPFPVPRGRLAQPGKILGGAPAALVSRAQWAGAQPARPGPADKGCDCEAGEWGAGPGACLTPKLPRGRNVGGGGEGGLWVGGSPSRPFFIPVPFPSEGRLVGDGNTSYRDARGLGWGVGRGVRAGTPGAHAQEPRTRGSAAGGLPSVEALLTGAVLRALLWNQTGDVSIGVSRDTFFLSFF